MWDYEGLPVHARLGVGSTKLPGPHGLRLSFGDTLRLALLVHRGSPVAGPGPGVNASVRCSNSSHGVVRDPPLHRHGCLVSTPAGSVAPKSSRRARFRRSSRSGPAPASARGCHVPDSFRPCRSSRLRRFSPPGTLQVCCTLLPILGFAMFPVDRGVAVCLTFPSAEAVGGLGVRRCSARTRGGVLPSGFYRPCRRADSSPGGRACSATRRLLVSLDLSQWRSTLRSFSLANSCAASTVPFCRTPGSLPSPGVNPVPVSCLERDSASGAGHRGRCLLAVVRGFTRSRLHAAQALRVDSHGLPRSPDLKAFVR